MQAGQLDRRIDLLRSTISYDAFNSPIETWTTLATVWASRRDISDGERFQAGQMNASRMTRFQIRWSNLVKTLSPKDRLQFEGVVYDIMATKELNRHEGIEITASSRADGAA